MPSAVSNLSPQVAYSSTQVSIQSFTRDIQNYQKQHSKLLENLQQIINDVECLHRHYDRVSEERAHINVMLEKAENSIRDVRRVVDRFAIIRDAVVASDGFTYERDIITQYIEHSKNEGGTAMSQHANVAMTTLLIPNRSLKSLLNCLTEVLNNDAMHAPTAATNNAPIQLYTYPKENGHCATTGTVAASSLSGNEDSSRKTNTSRNALELNALGKRLHPCVRVYGFCNYKGACSYAKYPYDACLSNLKGRCRFRNHCHELHVSFQGPLDDYGKPISDSDNNNSKNASMQNPFGAVEGNGNRQEKKTETH